MRKTRFTKQLSKKKWLLFEAIALISACIIQLWVYLLDTLPAYNSDLWNYMFQSVIIILSLNLGFVLWKGNEWYKLWGWVHVAFFICSFVIINVFALLSIGIHVYDVMFSVELSIYIILFYSFIISAPLAAFAAYVKYTFAPSEEGC